MVIVPIAKIFAFFRLGPSHLTLLGLATSLLTAFSFYYGRLPLALLFLALSSLFDAIDGAVARLTGKSSSKGALMDSVLDRYSDGAVIIGISLYLDELLLGMLALLGSTMVSYTRARAEHFMSRCDVGLGERAERLIIILLALAVAVAGFYPPQRGLFLALSLVALLAFSTALERFFYAYTSMNRE